jgi:8-oxo-dGTP pyrophosphatase MutT (NUDIX family)
MLVRKIEMGGRVIALLRNAQAVSEEQVAKIESCMKFRQFVEKAASQKDVNYE